MNTNSKFYTAKQMALMSHNLSRDGMSATLPSGEVFKWSDHFSVWAGPFPRGSSDAKPPRKCGSELDAVWRNAKVLDWPKLEG